ncbi:MAG: helix-turn-helix domain-containing protein [Oscillospiraceae bacterium]|jgi:transcriptional regulator with XRE-family HTH domain|nr:helix-turn-helix domain-containing protein [Oscillospiraceae bacterium]
MKYHIEEIGKRIREERTKRAWSQETLGKTVSVTGKQISNYESGSLIPPIDMLLRLCEAFDCELGYLLGEADYSEGTKLQTAIHKRTGLSAKAIESIIRITGTSRKSLGMGYPSNSENYRRILNGFLEAPAFVNLIKQLSVVDGYIHEPERINEKLRLELGDELLKEAIQVYFGPVDYEFNPDFEPRAELIQAINKLRESIDRQIDIEMPLKIARYELSEAFEHLAETLYPRNR